MRRAAHVLALAVLAAAASRAGAQVPPPPKLEPVPEPPPAIGVDNDASSEGGVRLSPQGGERIEERVIDGKRVVRVTNPNGTEYLLVEDIAGGLPQQGPGKSPISVPLWLIHSW